MEKESLAMKLELEQYDAELAYSGAEGREEGREEGRAEVLRTIFSNQRKAGTSVSAICEFLKVSLNLTNDELLSVLTKYKILPLSDSL